MNLTKLVAIGLSATAMAMTSAHAAGPGKRVDVKSMDGAALVEYAAQPYIQFRDDIDFVTSNRPSTASGMREVHQRMASHDTRALAGSWVAYAAMVAADTPEFSAEIERRMKASGGAAKFAAEIESNPALIRNIPGSNEAIEAIMTFAASDSARVRKLGDSFIAEAYDLQKTAWARKAIAESGMSRVDSAMAYAAKRQWPTAAGRKVERSRAGTLRPNLVSYETWSGSWAGEMAKANPATRPGTIVTKALVLGAHYSMNTATQEHMAAFGTSKKSERCFSSAKMNLDQCIAATRTPYEEAFCLGQHAFNDTSSCVGWPAGVGASGT